MDYIHKITWTGLKAGYGVEDIAQETGVDVEDVRQCVRHFRAQPNKLASMYGRQKAIWRQEAQEAKAGHNLERGEG